MPSAKGKQRLSSSPVLTEVRAGENGNGIAGKGSASEKKKKIMRLKEFRELLQKKLKYDIGTSARHIRNWVNDKKPYLPPRSPFSLLQELFFYDPWKVLIACMFLNKTSGKQVSTVLYKFFSRYPTPIDLRDSNREDVIAIIKPLGLFNKRADMIVHFTKEFLAGNWRMPDQIKGIGKYANDAYRIFCCGEFKDVQPNDHALNKYHEWLIKEDNRDQDSKKGSGSASSSENNSNDSQDSQNPREISSNESDQDEKEEEKPNTKSKKNSGVKESKSAHHQAFLVAGELKWNIRREDLNISQEERDWWSELFDIRDYFYKKFQNVEIDAQSDEISQSEEEVVIEKLPKMAKSATKKRKIEIEEDGYEKKSKKKQKIDKEAAKLEKQRAKEEKKLEKAQKKENKKKKQIDREANKEKSTAERSLPENSIVITKTNLPPGWRFEIRKRQSGGTKGREDYYWYSPEGRKFRSLVEIRKHLASQK